MWRFWAALPTIIAFGCGDSGGQNDGTGTDSDTDTETLGTTTLVDALSEREFEVFLRLANGAAVPKIAAELNLSTSTVGTHLYNIKQKLHAGNQAELTLIALRAGLIER